MTRLLFGLEDLKSLYSVFVNAFHFLILSCVGADQFERLGHDYLYLNVMNWFEGVEPTEIAFV